MPSIAQIRAARALLDWSQSDLADHASLSQTGIARIENGTNQPNSRTLEKILSAFDKHGIEFLGKTGVRKSPEEQVTVYSGEDGFINFMKNVYEVLKRDETQREVVVNNVDEKIFIENLKDYAKTHLKRMEEIEARFRIIVEQGDEFFVASKYAAYKSIPSTEFHSISYYIYGNNAALINFTEDGAIVYVIRSPDVATFYRREFDKVWQRASDTN